MSKRGENIFKRADDRWEARYVKGREVSGKIKYGFCYGRTYGEAKEKAARCRAALLLDQPLSGSGGRKRLGAFCGEWLRAQRGRVKDSTYVKYDTVVSKHIMPKLGGCVPAGVDGTIVERFTQELLGEGLAVKTIRDILTVLRAVLKYAEPAQNVEIRYPKLPKRDTRVLSVEEQRRFAAYLQTDMDPCKFGVLLALLTGLRIGELCALRWRDVSLKDRTLRVEATMQRLRDLEGTDGGKTKIVVSSPKSDSSFRTIPLTAGAAALCARFDPGDPGAYLMTGTERFMEPRLAQMKLRKYTQDCGLEGVHFHTIRHTFATRCVESGFEIKSLSEIMGHASTSITLNRYVHASMELKRENMDKLAAVDF